MARGETMHPNGLFLPSLGILAVTACTASCPLGKCFDVTCLVTHTYSGLLTDRLVRPFVLVSLVLE